MIRKTQIWLNLRDARKRASNIDPITGKPIWYEHCKVFVRTVLAIPSNGNPTAYASWTNARVKHVGPLSLKTVPPFHPVFFAPTDHNSAGHIVLSAGLKRNASKWCWTTDMGGRGTITRQKYSDVERWCGGRILGWTEDLDGKPVEYV